jgi:predicted AAA+ superfamily ATPase
MNDLVSLWEEYLIVGGYPQAVDDLITHGSVQQNFINALWDVTAGEALNSAGINETQVLAMLKRLSINIASPLNLSSLQHDMNLGSHHTAKARLEDLTWSYLIWPCHQSMGASPKLAAHFKSNGKIPRTDSSQLNEQQIGLELLKSLERNTQDNFVAFNSLMYKKANNGKEVDFVGPALNNLGIEGKYVDKGWKKEAQTVRAQRRKGLLTTRSAFDINDPDVWAIPSPFIALAIGRG